MVSLLVDNINDQTFSGGQKLISLFDAGTDCGSRTQKESLSSQLSGGMKKKMKQQPVHQKRKMKMQDTRTEPLDSVSRRPRAININNLEHEEDSSSLRNPSELSMSAGNPLVCIHVRHSCVIA